MDILTALGAAVRRWYVSVPIVLIAVVLAAITFASAQATWSTNRLFVTTPPNQVVVDGRPQNAPTNSIAVAGGTRLLASLLSQNLNSAEVASGVTAAGGAGYFASVPDNTFPLISITAQGSDAETASRTLTLISDRINPVFDSVQSRVAVPPEAKYRVSPVTIPSPPVASVPSRTRSLVATLVAGVVLAILLSALVDALALRRRSSAETRGDGRGSVVPPSGSSSGNGAHGRVSDTATSGERSRVEEAETDVTGRSYVDSGVSVRRVNLAQGRSRSPGPGTGPSPVARGDQE